ncbi:MAG: hypothetical protein H7Y11_04565, partial [Armatimonadetes bacterium]|nr:hypothetical protein [Anaerolineae bacterium]
MWIIELVIRLLMFAAGVVIVLGVLTSAIRSFVLARSARDSLTSLVFRVSRNLFEMNLRKQATYSDRDRVMAMFAPLTLISLPIIWLIIVWLGYAVMYIAIGVNTLQRALILSGSSLLTLGIANEDNFGLMLLEFSEAVIGLILIAILIAYLPTMYAAFSSREKQVTLLEVRAGSPPSAADMLIRAHSIQGLAVMHGVFITWEEWFAEVEETHTSLPALVFFRSTKP